MAKGPIFALLLVACGDVKQSPIDANGDAGDQFCSRQMPNVFCQDFDSGLLAEQGWAIETSPGASIGLVASTRTAPYALEARTPASDGSADNDAKVTRAIPVPAAFQRLHVSFDVLFFERANALLPKEAFAISAPGYAVQITSNGATQNYILVQSSAMMHQAFDMISLGTWYRYEAAITRSSDSLLLSVTRDGTPIPSNGDLAGPIPAPAGSATWSLVLGAYNRSQNGASTFMFDNVLVTAE